MYPIQNNQRNILDISGILDFKTAPHTVGETNAWSNGMELNGSKTVLSVPLSFFGSVATAEIGSAETGLKLDRMS